MKKARVDESNWIRCADCGHKLMRVICPGRCDPAPIVEVKCHSCKAINTWMYDYWREGGDKR